MALSNTLVTLVHKATLMYSTVYKCCGLGKALWKKTCRVSPSLHTSAGLMRRLQPQETRGERNEDKNEQGKYCSYIRWTKVDQRTRWDRAGRELCFYSSFWRHLWCLWCVSALNLSRDHMSIKQCWQDLFTHDFFFFLSKNLSVLVFFSVAAAVFCVCVEAFLLLLLILYFAIMWCNLLMIKGEFTFFFLSLSLKKSDKKGQVSKWTLIWVFLSVIIFPVHTGY